MVMLQQYKYVQWSKGGYSKQQVVGGTIDVLCVTWKQRTSA
jgi:hypothetical protein